MTADEYRRIGQLYHAALELAPDQRAAFLDGACGDDEVLRREVESLLVAHERAAKDVFKAYRDLMETAPDELAANAIMTALPDGTNVIGIGACYCGSIEKGERILRPLRGFSPVLMDQVGPTSYTAMQKAYDEFYPPGIQDYWKAGFLRELSDEAIDTMIAYCANRPSPICEGGVEYQLGGAVSRVPPGATAFNHRDAQYSFAAIGMCTDPAETERCVQWAREFSEAMQPFSTGGVYVNYLGREADEGAERVKAAYGPEKYRRLVALKNKYDPTNLFRLNQNIKPTV